jgi:hypothetical protein
MTMIQVKRMYDPVDRVGAVVVRAALSGVLEDDPFHSPFTEQLLDSLGFRQVPAEVLQVGLAGQEDIAFLEHEVDYVADEIRRHDLTSDVWVEGHFAAAFFNPPNPPL